MPMRDENQRHNDRICWHHELLSGTGTGRRRPDHPGNRCRVRKANTAGAPGAYPAPTQPAER